MKKKEVDAICKRIRHLQRRAWTNAFSNPERAKKLVDEGRELIALLESEGYNYK